MKIGAYLLVGVLLWVACEDEDPGFTSLVGSWTYTTPDGKIQVSFDIGGGSTEILAINNPVIIVDGEEGTAVAVAQDIAETSIGKLRINANDVDLVYPFDIVFNDLSAAADFSAIDVVTATYTWPWSSTGGPTINNLNDIQITRK